VAAVYAVKRWLNAETADADTPQRDHAYGNYLDKALLIMDMTSPSDTTYYLAHVLHRVASILTAINPPAAEADTSPYA